MNNELRLTDEQVEKAARQIYEQNTHGWNWDGLSAEKKCELKGILRAAAAVHLQAPLAEPTEEELRFACDGWCSDKHVAIKDALNLFVSRRNAPPTVDPRREKVIGVLEVTFNDDYRTRADKILAALDEAAK